MYPSTLTYYCNVHQPIRENAKGRFLSINFLSILRGRRRYININNNNNNISQFTISVSFITMKTIKIKHNSWMNVCVLDISQLSTTRIENSKVIVKR